MKNPNATVLTDRFKRDPQYPGETVLFHPNYFSSEAIDILVAYNIELFESHGGTATHAGVYVDQINAGTGSPYPGPCLNPGPTSPLRSTGNWNTSSACNITSATSWACRCRATPTA